MTNPNNAVGTNGAYGGRTSVNAFNDGLALYTSRGVLSGWEVSPDSGMTVTIGGGSVRDVAVAEDAAGNRTTVNNISGSPISVTLEGAPSSGKRIDLIVGYVDNPPQGTDSDVDNPGTVGLITVSSAAASTPTVPTDSAIRSAITADGAAGSTAYYAVLGQLTITAGTTDIDSTMVNAVQRAGVGSQNVDFTTLSGNYSTAEIDTGFTWVDGKRVYKKSYYIGSLPNATTKSIALDISNLDYVISIDGIAKDGNYQLPINFPAGDGTLVIRTFINYPNIIIGTGQDRTSYSGYLTIFYTKTS